MWQDPYSLTIALDKSFSASGQLYSDDGVGYDYTQGSYVWKGYEFTWDAKKSVGTLRSANHARDSRRTKSGEHLNAWAEKIAHVEIEQVVLLGAPTKKPIRAALVRSGGEELLHDVLHMQGLEARAKEEGTAGVVVLKLPKVKVVGDWEIEFF